MPPRDGHWVRRFVAAGLVALAAVAGLGDAPVSAQTPAAAPNPLTTDEQEALDLAHDDKLLTARTRADEILKRDPDSIAGHFVLAAALRDAEGSLPRAMAHFKRARELYERRYPDPDADGRPWRLYADTLFQIAVTAGLMEDFEAELRAMDDYDERFSPKLLAQRVWPLMKLGRFDEARKWAQAAIDTGSSFQKLRALNGLCAVEAEEERRVANYEACLATYRYAKAFSENGPPGQRVNIDLPVYANNAHLGALAMLKYDEAEQLAIEGTKSGAETSSNPWLRLARMYIDQGRASEAVSATKAVQAWRARTPPATREQFSSEDEGTVALLLLTAGEYTPAIRLADRILGRPDRRAMTSTSPEHTAGGNALLRHAILNLGAELASERAASAGLLGSPRHLAESARLRALAWPDAQRVSGVLLDAKTLVATLRIYMDNSLDYVPTWMLGDLVDVLGPGVFLAGLDAARRAETEVPAYKAFYDAFEAEARLAQGDPARALDLARASLDALPKAEVLFKARLSVIAALAARRLGDTQTSLAMFERAMLADPGMVRRLGARLPARFTPADNQLASDTLARLRRSPRLEEASDGFLVTVTADAHEIQACMRTPLGAELGCSRTPIVPPAPAPSASAAPAGSAAPAAAPPAAPKADVPEPPERAARAFHKTLFALKMNLSDSDLRSLDGGPTATRDAARERMRELLGDDPAPSEPDPEQDP